MLAFFKIFQSLETMLFEESQIAKKSQEPLLRTMTGETYQPVRLFYQPGQMNALLGRFKRLKCIDHDQPNKRWVWLYCEEAKNLQFAQSYRDIPQENRPIVLGSFSFKGKELCLDVRSFERAINAITFFDQKINRRLARVSKIRVVNKLFSGNTPPQEVSNHHTYFFEECEAVDPLAEMARIEATYESEAERNEAIMAHLDQNLSQALPEVEELQLHYYEEGISQIEMMLGIRAIEAKEHWQGNKNFNRLELMQSLLGGMDEGEFPE